MIKSTLTKSTPIIIALLVFVLLSIIYFYPALEGKKIVGHDNLASIAMSNEIITFQKETDTNPLWTNSMFGGMPGYQINFGQKNVILKSIDQVVKFLGRPFSFIFLYLFCFYILLISLRINRWLAIVGAIAFAFSTYLIIILSAGHTSKAIAIGYLPGIVAGIVVAFNKKRFWGALLLSIFLALEIKANHFQITYYGFILIAIYLTVMFIDSLIKKRLSQYLKTILTFIPAVLIAIGLNLTILLTTWEYSHETIRGPSELTHQEENQTSGLDKDYVVQWSYGIDETLTLLIPNFKGGASQINPGIDSESYQTMRRQGVQNLRQNIRAVSTYHGDQPSTAGPVYVGAIVVLLFILGLFVVQGPMKWWLLLSTVFTIILSWGGNIMWLTSFLLDYLPLYNKFRAPTIILSITELAMPLLGFIALNNILTGKVDKKIWLNGLKWSVIITGGISLLFVILPGIAGNFSNATDAIRYPDWLIDSVIADRKAMLRSDAFRSFLFVILGVGALYVWNLQKIKTNLFVGILGVLILIDLWGVDKRYLNNDNFESKKEVENPFPMMPVDKEILKDTNLSYRVLPLQNPFQDARTSYYHKNVGGYHAAKLRRYQELIDFHLMPEIQEMVKKLQAGDNMESVFSDLPAINMLNTRYIIYDLNQAPIQNPNALGNAWFVSDYKMVKNADDEIDAMNDFIPSETAIVDQRFEEFLNNKEFKKDENGSITLTEYQPNYLKYSARTATEQLAVFSEIYYANGWDAYVDGNKVPHFRVNYVLRAMVLPEGEHTVEFKFEPKSYYIGNKISLASSFVLIFAVIAYGFVEFRRKKKKN
ncbi:YfhO family protein [Maribellus maritimus]|uniref:YfhO family protein n=1 Tax=Maribellus maritimus TaxID=2870838 RepID=UPI001EEBF74E|nr:YfhO family protein [Maribellus maritimus]MCG6188150.1 YfhO family protein [Maribellus maritimus]